MILQYQIHWIVKKSEKLLPLKPHLKQYTTVLPNTKVLVALYPSLTILPVHLMLQLTR